jgi:hypothetical protein
MGNPALYTVTFDGLESYTGRRFFFIYFLGKASWPTNTRGQMTEDGERFQGPPGHGELFVEPLLPSRASHRPVFLLFWNAVPKNHGHCTMGFDGRSITITPNRHPFKAAQRPYNRSGRLV